ncbi:Hypothetical protein UVM_LOCUS279 [uncultured virus]|nr:Hypothetical protein UVM_LOCUS279 [uncultured virus]
MAVELGLCHWKTFSIAQNIVLVLNVVVILWFLVCANHFSQSPHAGGCHWRTFSAVQNATLVADVIIIVWYLACSKRFDRAL